MADLITLSVIKADVGGYVGHSTVHPALLDAAREQVSQAIERKLLIDGYVTHCGDDLQLIMTHPRRAPITARFTSLRGTPLLPARKSPRG